MQIDITVSLIQLTGHLNVQFSDCHSLFMQTDFLLDDSYNHDDDVPAPIMPEFGIYVELIEFNLMKCRIPNQFE